jgi:hypothetical protein
MKYKRVPEPIDKLLNMRRTYDIEIKDAFSTYVCDKSKNELIQLETCAILVQNISTLYNHPEAVDLYISGHGRTINKNKEIYVYDKKIIFYGPDKKILTSPGIMTYIPPNTLTEPLAYIRNGLIHPYNKEALSKLKNNALQPNFFTGVTKSLTHMLDHKLARFEDSKDRVTDFDKPMAVPFAAVVIIKNSTTLSKLFEELDKTFGKFKSYSLSFCRCSSSFLARDSEHRAINNAKNMLRDEKYDLYEIQKSLLTQSVVNDDNATNVRSNHSNDKDILEIENLIKDDLLKTIDENITIYSRRDRNYNKLDLFHLGYSKADKLSALKTLKTSLERTYYQRKFTLSPRTIKILFNGRLGKNLKYIASQHSCNTNAKMLSFLGFDI